MSGNADRVGMNAELIEETLKKAYPFNGIRTPSEARGFLSKAKRLLEPLGVPKDVFERAEQMTRSSGQVIVWPSDRSILRGLYLTGWLK